MRFFLKFVFCFLSAAFASAEQLPSAGTLNLEQVRSALGDHVGQMKFASATWGVQIVSLKSGVVLFETNAQKLLKPASNAKLFTAAVALDTLGPEYRIVTSLHSAAKPDENGNLPGDLIIYGRGDPSFSARFQNGSYTNLLKRVVAAIKAAGIKNIEGDLIGDDTFFAGRRYGTGWTSDDLQYYYGAEVSALSIQDNVIDLLIRPGNAVDDPCKIELLPATKFMDVVNRTRTGETNVRAEIRIHKPLGENRAYLFGTLPKNHGAYADAVPVSNPALWFVTLLREALAKEKIQVRGDLWSRTWPDQSSNLPSMEALGEIESEPAALLIQKMLKPSQNLYAQLLLLHSGARTGEKVDAEACGVEELRQFAARAGIPEDEMLLDDGSGLSRSCLVTPGAIVRVLRFMAEHQYAENYRASLPQPGERGTLRNRLTDLKSVLRAKTGTIRYVNTLAGYISTQTGEELAFSIMLNAYANSRDSKARDEIDVIPRVLSRLNEETGSAALPVHRNK